MQSKKLVSISYSCTNPIPLERYKDDLTSIHDEFLNSIFVIFLRAYIGVPKVGAEIGFLALPNNEWDAVLGDPLNNSRSGVLGIY